ncbi:hypothetical protein H0H81_008180 [Sphagnurus paluster]|uniref:HAT C-terminal dimerisation domain-containing protein n=1 Tax=Sphagnurus paluster TaxID=117069 RepID=A0A9P7K1Z3_9AGAR|nr:hypothetical protein H0H81_008180 [Sphagnurus paluster]
MKEMYESDKLPLDIVHVWGLIDTQLPHDPPAGRNALVKLAIWILTPVTNSAGCECSFSLFGTVHTKHRNKLKVDHIHKVGALKMAMHHEDIANGHTSNRSRKRKFGEIESDSLHSNSDDPENFLTLGETLICEAM